MAEGVTAEDLARDLTADLEAYWDIQRDAQLGLILGPPKDGRGSGAYEYDVYEFANMAHVAWPAAMRLALHWKAEAARLAQDAAGMEAERDQLSESRSRLHADAAVLRSAFTRAAEAYYRATQGKPRGEWAGEPMEVWRGLYEAVRDSMAGMELLADLAKVRAALDAAHAEGVKAGVEVREAIRRRNDSTDADLAS